ncbi:ScbR family autoregulator-binding transcription factor [Streptomyces sp. NPDC005209]|uniref:ScbR family autoregulator-binding transcription factor n=1 Tax=Streptomyces sp. NPDC005209 TaxID=3156715 RepID=UPI0033A22666
MVKQERAARTRDALIRSAAEIFDREGFTAASLTTISSQAGVSNGALHFHFPSKGSLADAVESAAANQLQTITDAEAFNGKSRLQHLVDVTHVLTTGLREDVVLRAGFELSGDTARASHVDLRACWQAWVQEAVGHADDQGELCTGVSESAVTALVAATVGFEVLGSRDSTWLSQPRVTQFWRLLLPRLATVGLLDDLEAAGSRTPSEDQAVCF